MQEKPALLQRVFYRLVYNPLIKTRSIIQDFYLKNIYNPTWTTNGELITAENGSKIDSVFTAINTIAREIASTPVDIKQDTENGKIRRKDLIQYRLLSSRPNYKMSSYVWLYSNVFCYLAWGNAYNLIKRDGNSQPTDLIPLMPWNVKIIEEDGEIFYVHKNEPIPARDILHFKAYTINGLEGISPIVHNAQLMGHKINQQRYSDNSIGTKPNGFISGDLTEEQMDQLSDSFTGRMKQGKLPFINGIDAKYNPISIPPNEAQYIETSQYTDQKIYGIYNLPPTFAQDYDQGVKANAEQQALTLVKHTLIPHYMLIEQELNEKLFTERNKSSMFPLFVKFNANGKMRGDMNTRKEYYQTMITSGVMNANEVRELEDMPRQDGDIGDKYYIQGAMVEKGKEITVEQ